MLSLAKEQDAFISALRNAELNTPLNIYHRKQDGTSKRFNVYRNNVTVSLIESLGAGFPAIKKLVGDEFFNAVAHVFVQNHPPTSPLMYVYGQEFGAFLRSFEPAQSLPYLGDLADIEWNLLYSTHAKDASAIAIDALTKISEDQLEICKFTFHPSLFLGQSNWQVGMLWSKIMRNPDLDISDLEQEQYYIIVRPYLETNIHIIPGDGAFFLQCLMSGDTLGQASEKTTEKFPEFNLGEHLGGLFSFQIVTNVNI